MANPKKIRKTKTVVFMLMLRLLSTKWAVGPLALKEVEFRILTIVTQSDVKTSPFAAPVG